jgi:ribokinase
MRACVIGNYMNAHFLCVDRLPGSGESLLASAATSPSTTARGGGLHRLGVAVDLLMAVGQDAAGSAILRWLEEEGIGTHLVHRLGADSGFGVGFVAADGRNFLAAHLGANALLSPRHVDGALDALAAAEWVLASFESPDALVLQAFRHARRLGKRTYLNPSPWRTLGEELAALTDVLVVNAPEAALLCARAEAACWTPDVWRERLPALARALDWRGELLAVTLAEAGCVAVDGNGRCVARPAYPIRQVDATGAGDAFGSGLVWSLGGEAALDEVLAAANACGALVAACQGILAGLPSRADLEAFMAGGGGSA